MAHGTQKPRNKYLNELLASKRNGVHEDKVGKHTQRAKTSQAVRRALRQDGFSFC